MWSSSIFCVPSTWMAMGTCCMFSVRFSAVTTTVSMPPLSAANATVVSAVDASNVERNTPRAVPIPLMQIPSKRILPVDMSCRRRTPVKASGFATAKECEFRNTGRRDSVAPSSWPGLSRPSINSLRDQGVWMAATRAAMTKAANFDSCCSKFRHTRIRLDRIAERVPQLPQQRLEPAPLLDAVSEDRLAHLFGAGGAHRALGFVEAQALLLERQPAMVEQAADLRFRLGDHVLVQDAMHAAGQHGVEMRHQARIVAPIAAEIAEVVAEGLAAREMLLEVGQAARHRMAPRVDDPGIGQDQMDKAHMQEIVRHLVDEERSAEFAMHAGAREIVLADLPQARGLDIGEQLGIAALRAVQRVAVEPARERGDVGQLHRAFHLGMAGQDLLDQRRARARHADDEDRIAGLASRAAPRREELRRERRARAAQVIAQRLRLIFHGFAAQRVGEAVLFEGFFVETFVLQRLAEREMEVEAVLVLDVASRDLLAHRGRVVRREAEGLEVRKAPPRLAEAGLEAEALAISSD